MHSEFVPLKDWPARQPWRMVRSKVILIDPDTGQRLAPADATTEQLDRLWTAMHSWEKRHAGTFIGDHARTLRRDIIEAEDTARRAIRLADPEPAQDLAA